MATATWEVALFVLGLIVFLLLSAWVYWRTSDAYKIRRAKIALGYEVDDTIAMLSRCWGCFLGPMARRKWEKEHEFFRTKAYGPADPNWEANQGAWTKIERGDGRREKHTVDMAVARAAADITEDLFDELALVAFTELESAKDPTANEKARTITKRSSNIALADAQQAARAARAQQANEDLRAEWGGITNIGLLAMRPVLTKPPTASSSGPAVSTRINVAEATRPVDTAGPPRPSDRESVPLTIEQLRRIARSTDTSALVSQFKSIGMNYPDPSAFPRSLAALNRQPNVYPFKHNRVKLAPMGGEQDRYYNASFVRGPHAEPEAYIVAQAPMSGREHAGGRSTVPAFWHLLWQNNVHVVVATEATAVEYWPAQARASGSFGAITVVNKSVTHKPGFSVATLGVSCKDAPRDGERVVYHIQFLKWPVDALPDGATLLSVLHTASGFVQQFPRTPMLVLDAGTTGAAGCLLAVELGIVQIEERASVDILRTLARLREDRGGLLATPAQYIFVHKTLNTYCLAINAEPAPPVYTAAPSYDDDSNVKSAAQRRASRPNVYEGLANTDQLLTESQGRGVPQWKRDILRRGSADIVSVHSQPAGELAPCDNCEGTIAVVHCNDCRRNFCSSCDGLFVHATAGTKGHKRVALPGAAAAMARAANVAICENCKESPAALYCALCNQTVCTACDRMVLHKDPAKRNHQRTELAPHAGGRK